MKKIIINDKEYYFEEKIYNGYKAEYSKFYYFYIVDKKIFYYQKDTPVKIGKFLRLKEKNYRLESKDHFSKIPFFYKSELVEKEEEYYKEIFIIEHENYNSYVTDEKIKEKIKKAELSYTERQRETITI